MANPPPTVILTSIAVLTLAAATERADANPVTVSCSGDVTSQITTALNGTLASGGTLSIVNPSGTLAATCTISSPGIAIPSGVTIEGVGAYNTLSAHGTTSPGTPGLNSGASVTLVAATLEPGYAVLSVNQNATNVLIENLSINGNGSSTSCPGNTSQGIQVSKGASAVTIQNVEVANAGSQGIRIQGASDVTVTESYLHESRFSGLYVVGQLGSSNTIETASIQASDVTLSYDYVSNNNSPESCNSPPAPVDGIDIDRITANVTVEYNYITQGDVILFDNAEYYFLSGGTPEYGCSGHVVISNTIEASTSNGIDVAGLIINPVVQHNTIGSTGTTADSPAKYGIIVNGPINDPPSGNLPAVTTATINANTITAVDTGYDVVFVGNNIGPAECSKSPDTTSCTLLDNYSPTLLLFNNNNLTASGVNSGQYFIELTGSINSSTIDGNLCPGTHITCSVANGYVKLGTYSDIVVAGSLYP